MDTLWAPWRGAYVKKALNNQGPEAECVFCQSGSQKEEKEALVLYKGKFNFVLMNLYPYNLGHLLVVPYEHLDSVEKLREEARNEHYLLMTETVKVLRSHFSCDGFNVGMNIGRSGGAGIDRHIHTHVVPRWNGDANFMPIIGKTKVMSDTIADVYNALAQKFREI